MWSLKMNHQPDFYQMSRPELRKYVLSHREDDEALRIYITCLYQGSALMYASGRNWERDEKDESPILQQYQNRCISNNHQL